MGMQWRVEQHAERRRHSTTAQNTQARVSDKRQCLALFVVAAAQQRSREGGADASRDRRPGRGATESMHAPQSSVGKDDETTRCGMEATIDRSGRSRAEARIRCARRLPPVLAAPPCPMRAGGGREQQSGSACACRRGEQTRAEGQRTAGSRSQPHFPRSTPFQHSTFAHLVDTYVFRLRLHSHPCISSGSLGGERRSWADSFLAAAEEGGSMGRGE